MRAGATTILTCLIMQTQMFITITTTHRWQTSLKETTISHRISHWSMRLRTCTMVLLIDWRGSHMRRLKGFYTSMITTRWLILKRNPISSAPEPSSASPLAASASSPSALQVHASSCEEARWVIIRWPRWTRWAVLHRDPISTPTSPSRSLMIKRSRHSRQTTLKEQWMAIDNQKRNTDRSWKNTDTFVEKKERAPQIFEALVYSFIIRIAMNESDNWLNLKWSNNHIPRLKEYLYNI